MQDRRHLLKTRIDCDTWSKARESSQRGTENAYAVIVSLTRSYLGILLCSRLVCAQYALSLVSSMQFHAIEKSKSMPCLAFCPSLLLLQVHVATAAFILSFEHVQEDACGSSEQPIHSPPADAPCRVVLPATRPPWV